MKYLLFLLPIIASANFDVGDCIVRDWDKSPSYVVDNNTLHRVVAVGKERYLVVQYSYIEYTNSSQILRLDGAIFATSNFNVINKEFKKIPCTFHGTKLKSIDDLVIDSVMERHI
jgi:hypothetical protein